MPWNDTIINMTTTTEYTVLEVERKRTFTGNVDTFIATLRAHGFAQTSQLHENDTYYSRPDVDFMQTVECLRVRERDGFAEVTYKPATSHATSTNDGVIMKPETNLSIAPNDTATAKQLLVNLGMIELVTVTKFRRIFTSAAYPSTVIAIDEIANVGTLIETEVTLADKAVALQTVDKLERLLDIDTLPLATKPYRDMCMKIKPNQTA